jgi:MSHA pilin protein MshD
MKRRDSRNRGFTLIELIVSIAVISIAVTGVLGILSDVSVRSGQSLVQAQATQIASAYLNEVLSRPFADPDGTPIEPFRALFDDVADYNGLVNVGARDQFNNPIPGLTQFTVTVQVSTPPAGTLGAVPQPSMFLVTVSVTHPTGVLVVLNGYRTQHP